MGLSEAVRARAVLGSSRALIGVAVLSNQVYAQQAPVVTAADYARAELFLRENTFPLVTGMNVQPMWLTGDRFGYRNTTRGGSQFILLDPAKATRVPCSPETGRCGGALEPREESRGPAGC